MIGIQSAFEKEIELVCDEIDHARTKRYGDADYVVGKIADTEVVAVAGGKGKVCAASSSQILIDLFDVKSIVFCGVAGCVNPRVKIGHIVVSRDAVQYDHIADIKTAVLGGLSSRFNETRVMADRNLVELAQAACAETVGTSGWLVGTILTGDRPVITRRQRIELFRKYAGDCVDMEGAAVGMVCARNRVPFVVVRVISDSAGFLTPVEFKRNLPATSRKVQEVVLKLVSLLSE